MSFITDFRWDTPFFSFVNRLGIQRDLQTEPLTMKWHFAKPYLSVISLDLPIRDGSIKITGKYNIEDKQTLIQVFLNVFPFWTHSLILMSNQSVLMGLQMEN